MFLVGPPIGKQFLISPVRYLCDYLFFLFLHCFIAYRVTGKLLEPIQYGLSQGTALTASATHWRS